MVVPEHLKGHIYVEAYKQAHVKQAIEGTSYCYQINDGQFVPRICVPTHILIE